MSDPALLFLREDLVVLDDAIESLSRAVFERGLEPLPAGPLADELFAEFESLLVRLGGLRRLRSLSGEVTPPVSPSVATVGTVVTFLRLGGLPVEPERVVIGSAPVPGAELAFGAVSYLSDLGLLLLGAAPGDVRRGVVLDEEVSVRVLSVEPLVLRG